MNSELGRYAAGTSVAATVVDYLEAPAISERVDDMMAAGLLEEVRRLQQRGDLHADLPAIRSVMSSSPDHIIMGMSAETFWDGHARAFDFFGRNNFGNPQIDLHKVVDLNHAGRCAGSFARCC